MRQGVLAVGMRLCAPAYLRIRRHKAAHAAEGGVHQALHLLSLLLHARQAYALMAPCMLKPQLSAQKTFLLLPASLKVRNSHVMHTAPCVAHESQSGQARSRSPRPGQLSPVATRLELPMRLWGLGLSTLPQDVVLAALTSAAHVAKVNLAWTQPI